MAEDLPQLVGALVSSSTPATGLATWNSIKSFLEQTCNTETDRALSALILLDQSTGLPLYLQRTRDTAGMANLREAIFKWLTGFIKALPQHAILQHAPAAAGLCKEALRPTESSTVSEACLQPLASLCHMRIASLASEAAAIAQTLVVRYSAGADAELTAICKGKVLALLGVLLNAYPEEFEGGELQFSASWLVDHAGRGVQPNVPAFAAHRDAAWGHIKGLLSGAASCTLERYDFYALHAGLHLLADQAWVFAETMMASAEELQAFLKNLEVVQRLNSKSIKADPLRAAWAAVIQAIAGNLLQQSRDPAARAVASALLEQVVQQHLLEPILQHHQEPRQVSVALAAAAHLTEAIADLMGAKGLEAVTTALLPLHASADGEGLEGYHVPLLRALARLLKHLPYGQQAVLPTCLQVAQYVGNGYNQLRPRIRSAADAAFQELVMALVAAPGLSHNALHQLVSMLLATTLQQVDRSGRASDQGDDTAAWKHLMPLWACLLSCTWASAEALPSSAFARLGFESSADLEASGFTLQDLSRRVFDALMNAILGCMSSLKLQYSCEVTEGGSEAISGGPAESDLAAQPTWKPQSADDMLIFEDLSGFFAGILEGAPDSFVRPWRAILAQELVQMSRAHPMLSGFHHMLRTCLSRCSAAVKDASDGGIDVVGQLSAESGDDPRTAICAPYLQELCVAKQSYTNGLLDASLHLILTAPPYMLAREEVVDVLQQAFTLGMQQHHLAAAALQRLETWETDDSAQELCAKVAPSLEPYLHTVMQAEQDQQHAAAVGQEERGQGLRAESAVREYKQARAAADAEQNQVQQARLQGLAALQRQIQGWLGRNPQAAAEIALNGRADVQAPAAINPARWDEKDKFILPVHLQEGQQPLQVSLDLILPQVARLAESAADRSARVAACEFLHASILWAVGNSAKGSRAASKHSDARPTERHGLLAHALPVALRLAASEDGVMRALFRPLIVSLIHWLTRNLRREAADTMALLEAILAGLTSSGCGGRLRAFCAEATQEFLVSSESQTPSASTRGAKAAAAGSNVNASSLLRRLMDRLVHPDAFKRLGAAKATVMCAQSLMDIAGRDPTLARDHCLELIQCCITGLRLAHSDPLGMGTCPALAEAVKELVKVLAERQLVLAALLEAGHEAAPAPATAASLTSLNAFLRWLWPLTAAPERQCRGLCMWLHERLCELLLKDQMSSTGGDAPQRTAISVWLTQLAAEQSKTVPETVSASGFMSLTCTGFQSADPLLGQKLQELEGRCHWASWALDEGMLNAAALHEALQIEPDISNMLLKDSICKFLESIEAASPDLHSTIAQPMQIPFYSINGHRSNISKLSSQLLSLVEKAAGSELMWPASGLHALLLRCLLLPATLGLAPSDSRLLALKAKGALEAVAAADASFVAGLRPKAQAAIGQVLAGSMSGQHEPASAGLEGIGTLAELCPPQAQCLLQPEVLAGLPEQLLARAAGLTAMAGPEAKLQGNAALQLAVRLGLQPAAMLAALLHSTSGVTFYSNFPAVVHAWVARELQKRLILQRLLSCTDAVVSLAAPAAGCSEDLASSARQCLFIRVLTLLLHLDARAVLSAEGQPAMLQAYLSVLRQIGQGHVVDHQATLGLLRFWLQLPADEGSLQDVHAGIADVVKSALAPSSRALAKESPAASPHITHIVLGLMDVLVAAAEEGTDVCGALLALGPVLEEMGTLGQLQHIGLQYPVQLGLAALAFAPWASTASQGTAEDRARALLQFAWQGTFEGHAAMPQSANFRRAMIIYLLLPALDCTPVHLQAALFKDWAPHLRSLINSDAQPGIPGSLPGLGSDEATGLVVKMAAFLLLGHAYGSLPYATLVQPDLGQLWGGNTQLLELAKKQAQSLECTDASLARVVMEARASAMAAAASVASAAELRPAAIADVLRCPGPTWECVVGSAVQPDVTSGPAGTVRSTKDLAARWKASRLASSLLVSSNRASLASLGPLGATMPSMPASLHSAGDPYGGMQASSRAALQADAPSPAGQAGPSSTSAAAQSSAAPEDLACPQDHLNQHICTLPLIRLVEHAVTLTRDTTGMPQWMSLLHKLLTNKEAPAASRIFIARLIAHVVERDHQQKARGASQAFARWKEQWAVAFLEFFATVAAPGPHTNALHDLHVDACVLVHRWTEPAAHQLPGKCAERFVSHLVANAFGADAAASRNNFNLIKMLLGKWQSLPLPLTGLEELIYPHKGTPAERKAKQALGLKLLAVGVAYRDLDQLRREPVWGLLRRVLQLTVQADRSADVAEQAGEIVGIVLARLAGSPSPAAGTRLSMAELSTQAATLLKQAISLEEPSKAFQQERAILAAETLTSLYPELLAELQMSLFTALQGRLKGAQHASILAMLHRRAVQLSDSTMLPQLRPHVPMLLSSGDAGLQNSCVKLLSVLLPHAADSQAGAVLELIQARAASTAPGHKHTVGMLRDAWQQRPNLRAGLRGPLLALLSVRESALRPELTAFWHAELPKDLAQRLQSLLVDGFQGSDALISSLEAEWSMRAALLSLELAKGAADKYHQPLFDSGLGQCSFQDCMIDTSGTGQSEALTGPRPSEHMPAQALGPKQGGVEAVSVALAVPDDASRLVAASDTLRPEFSVYRRSQRLNTSRALGRSGLREQAEAGRSSIGLLNAYRIGQLPDVERVSIATLLGPLGLLASRDASIARLTVLAMHQADAAGRHGAAPRTRAQHEAASSSGSGKHVLSPIISKDNSTWAALYDVYCALGEQHLADSSLCDHIARCPGTTKLEPTTAEHNLWDNQTMRCLETLGEWSMLEEMVDTATGKDESHLFTDPSHAHRRLAFVRACLFQVNKQQRMQNLLAAGTQIECPVEEALCAATQQQWDRVRAVASSALSAAQEQWSQTHPISQHQRLRILEQMQPLAELQEAAALMQSGSEPGGECIHRLPSNWQQRWPLLMQPQGDSWQALVYARVLLLQSLGAARHGISEMQALDSCALVVKGARSMLQAGFLDSAEGMLSFPMRQMPASANAAAGQLEMHRVDVQVQIAQVQAVAGPPDSAATQSLEQAITRMHSMLEDLAAIVQPTAGEVRSLHALEGSAHWALAQGYTASPQWASQHIAEAVASFKEALEPGVLNDSTDSAAKTVAHADLDLALLCNKLVQAQAAAGTGNEASIGLHPDAAAGLKDDGPAATFVCSILRAMRHSACGGAELYVPRVLALLHDHAAARNIWLRDWQSAPLHLLLPWAAQMLSLVEAAEGPCLMPALQALAASYQSRLYFPYQLSCSTWGALGKQRASLLDPAMHSPLLAAFGGEANNLALPIQRWMRWHARLFNFIAAENQAQTLSLYVNKVLPDMVLNHQGIKHEAGSGLPVAQTLNAKHASTILALLESSFGQGGVKLQSMTFRAFSAASSKLIPRDSDEHDTPVMDSSTFKNCIQGAKQLLLPQMTHAHSVAAGPPAELAIMGFGKTVHVFSSNQRPLRLVILTEDFQEHEFLVKGGEELRLDQRIQQLQGVMNGLLAESAPSRALGLQVKTYDVVPINDSLGMVAFVPGTLPLLSVIQGSHPQAEEEMSAADEAFGKYITVAGGSEESDDIVQQRLRLYSHATPEAISAGLQSGQRHVRWDCLRAALLKYAGSPEKFMADRRRFTASLVALSASGYVLGIGDRHLNNFLLETASGRLIPIDFGFAFGSATQCLTVPETLPFRLTRQLTGVMLPHDAKELLQAPCSAALRALRDGKDIIEGILGAYLREPLLDWQQEALMLRWATQEFGPFELVTAQYMTGKAHAVVQKLEGMPPADIMIQELQPRHGKGDHWPGLQRIVKGPLGSPRARLARRGEALSCEAQAVSLLDMATDNGMLGTSFRGFQPWL
ncbi:hypothetical protein WJX73_001242 [Symbiochloris irregularis]|uniref:PI3K/PI4K catalytic domain-containing protein n=1 Tax=Symbiochloris irregularis TaxID=706552 RepID=A0AAW1PYP9_9CHLO